MGIKAPSCMAGLASAASTFGQSVKKTGVAAYNKLDRFAAKHPLVAAATGIAVTLLGTGVAAVLAIPLPPLAIGVGVVAGVVGGTLIGRGLVRIMEEAFEDRQNSILSRLTAPNEKTTKAQPKYSLFQGQKRPNDEAKGQHLGGWWTRFQGQKQPNDEDCVFSVNKEF